MNANFGFSVHIPILRGNEMMSPDFNLNEINEDFNELWATLGGNNEWF